MIVRSSQTTKCLSINRIIGLFGDRILWFINGNVYTSGSVIQAHGEVQMF